MIAVRGEAGRKAALVAASILLLHCLLWPVQAGQFSFAWQVHHRADWQEDLTVGDINGDGLDDIASVNTLGEPMLRFQQSNGAIGPAQRLEHPVFVHGLRIIDLGQGGAPTLAVGDVGGLNLYAWNGSGFDVTTHQAPVECNQIVPADVDQDGDVDVFCNGRTGAALFFNEGGSGFAPVQLELPGRSSSFALFDDVTGDGFPDLMLTASNSNSFFLLDNDGAGGFAPAVAYPYEANLTWSSSLAAGDLDGDGSKEIYATRPCNNTCAKVLAFSRNEQGYFSLSRELETLDIPDGLRIEDIDKDGRLDLLVNHGGWSTLGRYMGRDAGLWPVEFHSSVPRGGFDLGDVNGDGQFDAVFASSFGITVLYGGRKQPSDFNGDLVSDLVWRHASGRNVIWYSADSSTSKAIHSLDPAWKLEGFLSSWTEPMATAFWRNGETGENALWSLDQLVLDPMPRVSDTGWGVVGSGDFDGDDRADLLWRHAGTGENLVWPDGDATRSIALATVNDKRWRVVGVGDFDGDGLADIAWRHQVSGQLVAWPRGDQALQRSLATVNDLGWEVAGVGDFDRDGKDDLVWRQRQTGHNRIWRSADASRPQAVQRAHAEWSIAAIGDYDGDGRSDLLWRHAGSGRNVVWYSADHRLAQELTRVGNPKWAIASPR